MFIFFVAVNRMAKQTNLTRKNLAYRARRASVTTNTSVEDALEKLIAARRVLQQGRASVTAADWDAAQATEGLYTDIVSKSTFSTEDLKRADIYRTAVALVPL